MNNKKVWIALLLVIALTGAVSGYLFMKKRTAPVEKQSPVEISPGEGAENLYLLRMYLPADNRLAQVERKVRKRTRGNAVAEAVVQEFFRAPEGGQGSSVPRNVRLLGLYRDSQQTLYIDLSDELRREFQGDALAEYFLLKGLYESLQSNLPDIQDIRVLVEGKEIDSVGGHFSVRYPLRAMVSHEYKGDVKVSDETN